jgi:multiple sugar transport system ATP-binding protein
MSTLTLNGVRKSFGALEVLQSIDVQLADGEFLVLLGPSGCGKSTLLNIIAGLETPTAGDILIGDRRVNDVHPKDRNIAMVFQSYALYPTMPVERNIGFGLEMRGVESATRQKAVEGAAKMLQVDHLLDRKPAQLSGGQRQRVAMGRAIVREPELFLFDEPLSNLDAKLRAEMRTEIKRLHNRLGTTVVYVTHDQIEAMTLGTRIAVMKGGVIQQLADPMTTYEKPANLFVAGFIGSPSMNFINGRLARESDEVVLRYGAGASERVRLPAVDQNLDGDIGREVVLGIRPESLFPDTAEAPDMRGAVDVVEPTGPDTLVVLDLSGQSVTARLGPKLSIQTGSQLGLAVQPRSINLFDKASGDRL